MMSSGAFFRMLQLVGHNVAAEPRRGGCGIIGSVVVACGVREVATFARGAEPERWRFTRGATRILSSMMEVVPFATRLCGLYWRAIGGEIFSDMLRCKERHFGEHLRGTDILSCRIVYLFTKRTALF